MNPGIGGEPFLQPRRDETCVGPGMDRKYDLDPRCYVVQIVRECLEARWGIDVRRTVQRCDGIVAVADTELSRGPQRSGGRKLGDERIDHYVADVLDLRLGNTLSAQVAHAVGFADE